MSRLTEYRKDIEKYDYRQDIYVGKMCSAQKLGKIEDLEEQLGCPLDVYAKIQYGLVDKIYVKRYETVRKYWTEEGLELEQKEVLLARKITRVEQKCFYYQDFLGKESIGFSQYGKEFWLREDKSE